jgi:glyoxylase-like metal-dependent hydrolase (beta-lactamase superfamily II)
MHTITDGVYYQDAYAGVTLGAIILPLGTLLIDAPFRPEQARSWKSVLLTQSRGTHRLLVNLDDHIDRTLGNRYIDLTTITHQYTSEAIDNRANIFKGQTYETGSEWEKYPETIGARWTMPAITFNDHLQLHWGEDEIHLDHRPGPAEGAIWVEIPSKKIVFVGDAVLANQPPFLENAKIPAWLESISILRKRKYRDYTVVSGRSGPITAEDVKAQQALLRSIHGRIERLANRNAPIEETEKMIPALLEKLEYPNKQETFFTQRFKYGLHHYYSTHYNPEETNSEE